MFGLVVMDNVFLTLIPPILCLIIGFIVGRLIYIVREEKKEETPIQTGETNIDRSEIARLWHSLADGSLQVEMDGNVYKTASELDVAHLQSLKMEADRLRAWMGDSSLSQQSVSEDRYASQPEKIDASVNRPVQQTPAPITTQSSLNATVKKAELPPTPKSVVEMVNEILQEKIAGTPLADKGIQLAESPDKGVIVRVGLDHYPGPDAIPDPEIQAVIRAAVAEYNQTKGVK
jgi:hypothetical protein